jgi:hypothetical protein
MGSYVTAAGGETLKDLYRQLNPAMDYATFKKEVAAVNGGPLKVLDGGALEFGQKLNLPDSLKINAKPDSLVSQALSSGPFDLSAAQQAGTIRINPATGTPVAAIDPAARQTAARVTETMSQQPVAPGENRKVDYLREGSPDASWAKETLAKLDPSTKGLSYEDAFKKFQEANKLTVDGKPGPETLRKMQEQAKANAELSKSRETVTQAFMRWPNAGEDAAPAASAPAAAAAAPTAKAADATPAAKTADATPAAVKAVPTTAEAQAYVAALKTKSETNHPRNPGYHSSRETVAAFEAKYAKDAPKPTGAEVTAYLAALEQKENTNHPRNPGYHSSREAVAKFENAFPLSVPKVQEYTRLDDLWGPTRTERSQLATLKKELGI